MLLQMALFHSFLWLCAIPFCIYTTSSLSIPVSGYLSCFHALAIVNSITHALQKGEKGQNQEALEQSVYVWVSVAIGIGGIGVNAPLCTDGAEVNPV